MRFDKDDSAELHGEEIQDCTPDDDHARHGDIEVQMSEAQGLQGQRKGKERERETVHEAGRRQQGLQTDSTQKRAPCFWLMLEGFGILENGCGRRAMGG